MVKMYLTQLLMVSLIFQVANARSKVYMCYYSFGGMDPVNEYYDSLDAYMPLHLCTHVIQDYGFFYYEAESVVLRFLTTDTEVRSGAANTRLKAQKADVKFLASVDTYQQFIDDPAMRSKLVTEIQNFLTSSNMDGIDFKLQLIYDNCATFTLPQDPQLFAQNFDSLIDELRSIFPDKIFLISIEADPRVTSLFNFKHLMSVLDYVILKAYKSCMFIKRVTGFHAPLYAKKGEFSVDSAVRQVLVAGVRRTKLILSVRDGAQNFELADPQNNGLGAPVVTAAPETSLQSGLGIYRYCEVCGLLDKYRNSWNPGPYDFNARSKHSYYITTDTNPPKTIWLSSDDLIDRGFYVSSMRLAGISISSFLHYNSTDTDFCLDFTDFSLLHITLHECAWVATNSLAGRWPW